MMLLGILWALLAPLSLLLPFWLLRKWLRSARWVDRAAEALPVKYRAWLSSGIAATIVLLPVWGIWYQDYREFRQACQEYGLPQIHRTEKAEGFFLDDGTANSFGVRYLQEEGFIWMEARSIYKRDEFVRYAISADRKVTEVPQKTKTARFEVIGDFVKPFEHTSVNFTRIMDTQAPAGAQEMARSAMLNFSGGRMRPVLGIYGTADFPSVRTDTANWQEAYHLVRNTLGNRK